MSAQPWFKFFPADWRSDAALRMCSPVARCLWIEMLCIMYEAEPCGHLLVKGRPVNDRALAIQAGMAIDEVTEATRDLEENGVFSRTSEGVIFSRKMVRDARRSAEQKEKAEARWAAENAKKKETGNAKPDADGNANVDAEPHAHILEARSQSLEQEVEEDSSLRSELSVCTDPIVINDTKRLSEVQQAFDAYNDTAKMLGLPVAKALNPARRKRLTTMLKADGGRENWQAALDELHLSPHCQGHNDRQWKADFDFLLQAKSFTRLIEGSYRGNPNGQGSPAYPDRGSTNPTAGFQAMVGGARQAALGGRRKWGA